MLYMMVIVGIPCVAMERIGDVRVNAVNPVHREFLREDSAGVDMLMSHESIRPDKPGLHEPMKYPMKVVEVVIQIHSARQRRGSVHGEMRDHNHIGGISNNCLCPFDVRDQDSLKRRRKRVEIPGNEDRGLKTLAFDIVPRV